MKNFFLILFFGLCLSSEVSADTKREPLMVFAAASLTDALKEIASDFKKQEGGDVYFNFGGSKTLALQIEKGMPCDIFLAADKDSVVKLSSEKYVEEKSITYLLENRLVIAASRDSTEKLNSLFDLVLNKGDVLAMADPKTAPAGVYTMQAFTRAGLAERFRDQFVQTLDVRAALALVQSGNAKYAVVYATDARTTARVKIIYQIPGQLYDRIIYTGAIVTKSEAPGQAAKFLSFLREDRSKITFLKYGFQPFQH